MSKTAFLAPDPEAIHYDLDGNVHDDGRWIYAWNIENQLTQMTTTTAAVTAGAPNVRLTFQYDALGRRVSRKIEDNTGSWVTREELRFVYDGWNLIAEMNTSGTIQRYYTWGLDLSGSGSAMGGIGALLMAQDGGHTYLPAYDGSGNVAAMLDASNGSVAALYEYGPYGDLLRMEGAYAATNRFRWSTHFTDDDTGLVYYGHRYYSPSLGRFINRDPIRELGGLNVYGFAGNDPANGWDVLGLKDGDMEDNPDPLNPKPPPLPLTPEPGVPSLSPVIVVGRNDAPINPINPSRDFTSSNVPMYISGVVPGSWGDPSAPLVPYRKLSRKECDRLASKIANAKQTLASMINRISDKNLASKVASMVWEYAGTASSYSGLFKDFAEGGYQLGKTGLNMAGARSYRKTLTSVFKSASPYLEKAGFVSNVIDVGQIGADIYSRDELGFTQHVAEIASSALNVNPAISIATSVFRFSWNNQADKANTDVAAMDTTSATAYDREQSRNAVIGMNNLKQWKKEFSNGGCK